jgi:hypothetical protein
VRKVFTGTRLAWSVACSEEQVRDLLRLASRHCPGAVGAILDSLERFTASA